jgi:tetraprenyl-beta-curcumene synthase
MGAPEPTGERRDVCSYAHIVSVLGDRRLCARAGIALLLANARYWTTVAPLVHTTLDRWGERAGAIPDPTLSRLAIEKLRDERFNAEVAATLATLAPRAHRREVTETIVALQVMYDYLDAVAEQQTSDPLTDGKQLFQAFVDAVGPATAPGVDYYRCDSRKDDGGYLEELVGAVRAGLTQLPASSAIADVARGAARRCAEAQVRIHAVRQAGTDQLEEWAEREAKGNGLPPREFVAGAMSSVLAVHALVACAAESGTGLEQATAIDAMYSWISALGTMLDSLIDYQRDARTGESQYLRSYEDLDTFAQRVIAVSQGAASMARMTPNPEHNIMTLVGVVAYYTSAPQAMEGAARPATLRIHRELRPLIIPTLALMRLWRLSKRVRRYRPHRETTYAALKIPRGAGASGGG